MPKASTASVEAYLLTVPEPARGALLALRLQLRALLPDAEEVISYGVPAFKRRRVVVGFGAAANHCALYLFSGSVTERFKDALAGFGFSKGTVRFRPEAPLPVALLEQLVLARLNEL